MFGTYFDILMMEVAKINITIFFLFHEETDLHQIFFGGFLKFATKTSFKIVGSLKQIEFEEKKLDIEIFRRLHL